MLKGKCLGFRTIMYLMECIWNQRSSWKLSNEWRCDGAKGIIHVISHIRIQRLKWEAGGDGSSPHLSVVLLF